MEFSKESLIPQCVAALYIKGAQDLGQDFTIYALPVSDSLTPSMGWYMSFSGLDFNNGNDTYLCNAKNKVRVFKSLDALFRVAQDNFTGLVTVCCI